MKITKYLFNSYLEESKKIFEKKFGINPGNIEVAFIDEDYFINSALNDVILKKTVELITEEEFRKIYPNFAVVYTRDKSPLNEALGIPLRISISMDIAKRHLKKLNSKEIKAYILHIFIHEFTHIREKEIIEKAPELVKKAEFHSKGISGMFSEYLAEVVAYTAIDSPDYNTAQHKIWEKYNSTLQKHVN